MFLKNSLRNGRLVDPNVFTHLVSFREEPTNRLRPAAILCNTAVQR